MKEVLQEYAQYNLWANERLINTIMALPAELSNKQSESSFGSLRLTLLHLWNAESIWWQRLHLTENIIPVNNDDSLAFDALCSKCLQQSLQWQQWVMGAKEMRLQHVFAYRNSKKEEYKQPVYQVLMHVFNHGTYHRGQLVTILNQLKVEKIPATDFVCWCRNKKK